MNSGQTIRSIAFASGGSGGHSVPLMSVASAIKEQFPKANLFFVSSGSSVDAQIIPKAGYKFYGIPAGKLNAQSPLVLLLTFLKIPFALLKSIFIILRERPQFVLSAGGYAGAPFLMMASLFGIPCGIFEQNAISGMANRLMAKFSEIVFLNFAEAAQSFPGKKTAVVGNPCRQEIIEARWLESEFLSRAQSDPFRIFVFGGSQGAVGINKLVLQTIPLLKDNWDSIELHHQVGSNNLASMEEDYAKLDFKSLRLVPYVENMAEAYSEAHLVICRAGASSITELAAAGKAGIFIPLVSKDRHQYKNVQSLVDQGAGVLIDQQNTSANELCAKILEFKNDRAQIFEYSKRIQALYKENAELEITLWIKRFL